ncbi:MAG TPA: aldo/keto reductase [Candidatus Limnocylindrales bacterium]|jgi:aryl-alcohol dehydrogenase-like predicted oxidoreductase|nr:aldo/keto reductase [Candidatus Limnocylindrales bacterium]
MSQGATPDGTQRYAEKFKEIAAEGHFRTAQGLTVSSLGVGTYLGQPNDATDASYAAALVEAGLAGFNVFDTAINYRFQRSERNVGTALKVLANKGLARDEFVVCTKGGYLTPDGAMPADANRYFFDEYIQRGVFTAKEVAAGCHCMATRFIENQLNRSLKNLGVSCIDVYYLHNPETQLGEVPRPEFLTRVRQAFEFLESAVTAGKIQFYGMATWNGFRQEAKAGDSLFLGELEKIARDVAGGSHHCRFVQLPYNLAMTEALTLGNQTVDGLTRTMMEAAGDLGLTLVASASLLQGQLSQNLPGFVADALGLHNDLERALQFARSSPGITTALVGMSRAAHVEANAKIVGVKPAGIDEFSKLFERGNSA